MKKNFTLVILAFISFGFAQTGAPSAPYYNGFNWTLTGMSLKNALATKITTTHTNYLPYIWNATQAADVDPSNSSNVLLLYGFSNTTCPTSTADGNDHRSRNIFYNGGGNSCEWNREHVYAKSLGTPALDDSGVSDAGEDAHHLRACDVDRNGNRGSLKFSAGSGNSGTVPGGWYPGDEWKGDVARMMMYMYLRYPTQCLPINVGTGDTVSTDTNMIQLFLQWNAEDPVSQYEDYRNTYHGNTSNTYAQGNRNPFIDNPYLATVIWGGPIALNRWTNLFLSNITFDVEKEITVFPNPSNNNTISVSCLKNIEKIELISINGQLIQQILHPQMQNHIHTLTAIPAGCYLMKIHTDNQIITKKLLVN